MKGTRTTIAYAIALAAGLTASAQTLTEEIVIDREITPVVRNATRPTWVTPSIVKPKVETKRLLFNEYVGTSELTRSISTLEPAAWADSVMRSPYRGYASLAYFPAFNLEASAGYRLVRSPRLNAGVHLSYIGSSWNGWEGDESNYKCNKFAVGADATMRFTPGVLKADLDYSYSATDMAYSPADYNRGSQALNLFDIRLGWKPSVRSVIGWDLGAYFEYGGFTTDKTDNLSVFNRLTPTTFDFRPIKDILFGLNSNLSYNLNDSSAVLLGVGLDFRHVNRFDYVTLVAQPTGWMPFGEGSKLPGIIRLRPAYKLGVGKLSGHLGVQVDFNTGGLRSSVHVAPHVDMQWVPSSRFAARLKAVGGEVMNSNAELWQRCPWMTGVLAMERSHVNADIDLSLTFGSYKGFWAMLHGGWSSVSNWMAPIAIEGVNTWYNVGSFSGFNAGLELGYAWSDKLIVEGHASTATHRKYYRWQDNAKWVLDIVAKVRPIQPLQIQVGYESRTSRESFEINRDQTLPTKAYLGSTSNLFAGAEYAITDNFSAFLKVENILNRHWRLTNNVRSQGIHGLLGVQLRF